jgi:AraC family transcriptional regulator
MKKAIIITLTISLLLMVSCACPRPKPMTNMPPEPQLPKAPKTVSPVPEIVSMKALTLIGFEKDFDGENMAEIPSLWMKLMQVENQIKNRANNTEAWGASYNMNYGGDSFSFTYFAGYEVTNTKVVPEGMVVHVAPPSKYARFTHYGSLNDLTQTYSYIYYGWLPQSGYTEGTGNELEFYGQKFNPEGNDSEMFIFVPIQ